MEWEWALGYLPVQEHGSVSSGNGGDGTVRRQQHRRQWRRESSASSTDERTHTEPAGRNDGRGASDLPSGLQRKLEKRATERARGEGGSAKPSPSFRLLCGQPPSALSSRRRSRRGRIPPPSATLREPPRPAATLSTRCHGGTATTPEQHRHPDAFVLPRNPPLPTHPPQRSAAPPKAEREAAGASHLPHAGRAPGPARAHHAPAASARPPPAASRPAAAGRPGLGGVRRIGSATPCGRVRVADAHMRVP